MAQSVVLTTSGASFMATAGTMFPALPIRYALFSYDARLDTYVLPTSGITPILSADTVSAVGLTTGQVIYNLDTLSTSAYTISNNEFLLYDPNQSGTSTISNNRYDGTSNITLLNGVPLANSISATSIVYSYPNWITNGYQLVPGSNSVPTGYASSRDKYFRVNSFAPISCAAGGLSSGLFKVLIDNIRGNFKFNKVLLYATRILSGGVEDTSIDPVLVGIAYLNQPVIKSNDGSNLNFFEADIEVHFSANNYFGNVSFLSNNNFNYVGGEQLLWFDGKVALGTSAIPGSWLGRAKLHITENNPAIPMIRITNDNLDSYVDTYLSETFYQNEQSIESSKPVFILNLETSGTTAYSRMQLSVDHVNAVRSINMAFVNPTSGAINTGWISTYGGYLETSHLKFDSNILATFRSINNQYSTLVLGRDSETKFEHPGKFLTLHGGSLLVGSNLVSGSVSANGQIYCQNFIAHGSINVNDLYANTIYSSVSDFDLLRVSTSADFHTSVKVFGNITTIANVNAENLFANVLISSPNTWATNSSLVGLGMAFEGSGGLLTCQNFGVSTSAHFKGPVTLRNNLNANTVSADMISATNGFFSGSNKKADGYWASYTPTITPNHVSTSVTATYFDYGNYTIIGKTLIISFYCSIALNNASSNAITLSLPDGKSVAITPSVAYSTPIALSISSLDEHCFAAAVYGDSTFYFRRADSSNFPASTVIQVQGQIVIALD